MHGQSATLLDLLGFEFFPSCYIRKPPSMRSAASFLFLLPASVLTSPALDLKTLFCKLNNGVVKILDKDAPATNAAVYRAEG